MILVLDSNDRRQFGKINVIIFMYHSEYISTIYLVRYSKLLKSNTLYIKYVNFFIINDMTG